MSNYYITSTRYRPMVCGRLSVVQRYSFGCSRQTFPQNVSVCRGKPRTLTLLVATMTKIGPSLTPPLALHTHIHTLHADGYICAYVLTYTCRNGSYNIGVNMSTSQCCPILIFTWCYCGKYALHRHTGPWMAFISRKESETWQTPTC